MRAARGVAWAAGAALALAGCSLDWNRFGYDAGGPADVGADLGAAEAGADAGGNDAGFADGGGADADAGTDLDAAVDSGVFEQRSCMPPQAGCGLVEVSAGSFTLGDSVLDGSVPVQPVTITRPFAVDAYEVTVGRFRRFWEAGHPAPGAPVAYPRGELAWAGSVQEPPGYGYDGGNAADRYTYNWTPAAGPREDQPINAVTFWTAVAFCAWDGGRLPTEAEWEWVARGWPFAGPGPERAYVWGDDPSYGMDCTHVNWGGCRSGTTPVTDRLPVGGIYDLAGNVVEWVADAYRAYSDTSCWDGGVQADPFCQSLNASVGRSRRGGSFQADYRADPDKYYAAYRYSGQEGNAFPTTGFRCVRTR